MRNLSILIFWKTMMVPKRRLVKAYLNRTDPSWKLLCLPFDADHVHDHQTWCSITGIIVFVGSTLVLWPSKHQECIVISTYTAEFVTMHSAVEEAILIRYILRVVWASLF